MFYLEIIAQLHISLQHFTIICFRINKNKLIVTNSPRFYSSKDNLELDIRFVKLSTTPACI